MANPITAVIGGAATILGGRSQAKAASSAANAQTAAAGAQIDEQRRQFDRIQELLRPYVDIGRQALPGFDPFQQAGLQAFQQQREMLGLEGQQAQAARIGQLESDPMFQALVRQGENALLQNASATGGLRGGNLQAALARFRPEMLRQEIDRQYSMLGGMSSTGLNTISEVARLGQASAANTGAASSNMANAVSAALGQQGAAQAGAALARGNATANALSGLAGGFAMWQGMRGGQSAPAANEFAGPSLMSDLRSFGVF